MRQCSQMPYHAGIVLRIYPSNKQKQLININFGVNRFVYNSLIALNLEHYRITKCNALPPALAKDRLAYLDSILRNEHVSLSKALKNMAPFLYGEDVDSLAVDNAIKHYNSAWNMFRKVPRSRPPKFHKRQYAESYQTNAHYEKDGDNINDSNVRFLDNKHIQLPKIGRIRFAGSKKRVNQLLNRPQTRIGTITVRRDALGRYSISLQIASEIPFADTLPEIGACVGIDLNIDNFLWDSDNNVVENPKYSRQLDEKLKRAQRTMSRRANHAKKRKCKLRDAKNYQRSRARVAKIHEEIRRRGNEFRHVISKRYVESQDYIFAEDLKVSNMLKTHCLAKAISECAWYDFLNKLKYKACLYGKHFYQVPPHNTTQMCSNCGHVMKGEDKLTLGDREWVCPDCRTYHVRDYNAALNILNKGLLLYCAP